MIVTNFLGAIGMADPVVKGIQEQQGRDYPIQRVGYVEDTTNACLYLASDAASFITGINLLVDGGAVIGSAQRTAEMTKILTGGNK